MPEDLRTVVMRIFSHAQKQIELMAKALETEEYETVDFLAQVAILGLTELRRVLNSQLRFRVQKQ